MTVAPCSIYDHLFKTATPSVLTDPERQVFQEHWMSSQVIHTQLIPSVVLLPHLHWQHLIMGLPVIISKCTSFKKMFDISFLFMVGLIALCK